MNLKTAYEPYFKIGVAMSRWNMHTKAHTELLKAQFNSFTAENDMKPMYYLDTDACKKDPQKYDLSPALTFENAKPYLDFAKENKIALRGHTLVWHNQTPKWFFYRNYNENAGLATRKTMLARLENYIHGVLDFVQTNYPGVIYAWDVVNEAIDDGDFRQSLWLRTVGRDFVEMAFTFARKYAAPGVALFYNDYETALDWKRDLIIEYILEPLKAKGLIDGMGMQSHLLMDHPDFKDYQKALEMYGALGLEVQITELDMHNADPSEESMHALAMRYQELFKLLVEAKKSGKANVTAVTFWNLLDENSWLSGFRRETSYPLLFHGKCEAKEAYYKVLEVVCDPKDIDRFEVNYPEEDYKAVGLTMDRRQFSPLNMVCNFLKECGTYYLATVDGEQARVRPFGTAEIIDGKLCILTGKSKDVSKQIRKNPNVEICAFGEGRWIRIAGKLVRDDSRDVKVKMLEAYPHLRASYNEDDDNMEVLYFADGTATMSSFGAPSRSFPLNGEFPQF
ncbi:MAG: endo-1,4-beta-xylanase [Lachnospiraceae bacterium]|nr:endo-1,4-beta-xylanase [Lachnospiraceae bacterium]